MKYRLATLVILVLSILSCEPSSWDKINTPFPKPTGEFMVGTITLLMTKQAKIDSLNDRHINIQVWYPAKVRSKSEYLSPYIPDSSLIAAFKKGDYLNLDSRVLDGWDTLITYAYLRAELNSSTAKYPLIILSHGFGMSKNNYSVLSIELASHGYIVAAIDHPGSGLTILPNGETLGLSPNLNGPDGKVDEFCEDAIYVLQELFKKEKFKNKIDTTAIGMIGHSLGGAAALNIGDFDERFKAAINLDGYLFGKAMNEGVKIPFLAILQRPNFQQRSISDSLKQERRLEWKGIVQRSVVESTVINIDGLMHFDFSDLPFIIPDSVRAKNGGTLPALKEHQILSQLVITFFNLYLKDDSINSLQEIINNFEEVNYEINDSTAHNNTRYKKLPGH